MLIKQLFAFKDQFFCRFWLCFPKSSQGFSIIAVVLAMSVAVTLFTTVALLLNSQNKRSKTLSLKLDSLEIQHFITTVLSKNENCLCQFGGRSIDMTATPPELVLEKIHSGCDLTATENIIVKKDEMVRDIPGVVVDFISLRNIVVDSSNSRLYHANIVVQYSDIVGNQVIRPSIVDFDFSIDLSTLGVNTLIRSCFAPIKGTHECQLINETDTLIGCEGTIDVSGGVVSFGHKAGHSKTGTLSSSSGASNVFLGNYAGEANTLGEGNTFIGSQSGRNNQTGSLNTFVGYKTGFAATVLERNTIIGSQAFESIQDASNDNTIIGRQSGLKTQVGNRNVFVGYQTGAEIENSEDNIFIGYLSGFGFSGGPHTVNKSTFVGYKAGYSNVSSENTLIGAFAGENLRANGGTLGAPTSGSQNTFIGYQSGGGSLNDGSQNTFVGVLSGNLNSTGSFNTFIGFQAGDANTTGSKNTFIGHQTGIFNDIGESNTFIGRRVGYSNKSGSRNTFVGSQSGGEVEHRKIIPFLGFNPEVLIQILLIIHFWEFLLENLVKKIIILFLGLNLEKQM